MKAPAVTHGRGMTSRPKPSQSTASSPPRGHDALSALARLLARQVAKEKFGKFMFTPKEQDEDDIKT